MKVELVQLAHEGDFSSALLGRKAREIVQQKHGNYGVLFLQAIIDRVGHAPDGPSFLECRGYGVKGLAAQHKCKPATVIAAIRALEDDGYISVKNRYRRGDVHAYCVNPHRIHQAVQEWDRQHQTWQATRRADPVDRDVQAVLDAFLLVHSGAVDRDRQAKIAESLLNRFDVGEVLAALTGAIAEGKSITSLQYLKTILLSRERRNKHRAPAIGADYQPRKTADPFGMEFEEGG